MFNDFVIALVIVLVLLILCLSDCCLRFFGLLLRCVAA